MAEQFPTKVRNADGSVEDGYIVDGVGYYANGQKIAIGSSIQGINGTWYTKNPTNASAKDTSNTRPISVSADKVNSQMNTFAETLSNLFPVTYGTAEQRQDLAVNGITVEPSNYEHFGGGAAFGDTTNIQMGSNLSQNLSEAAGNLLSDDNIATFGGLLILALFVKLISRK